MYKPKLNFFYTTTFEEKKLISTPRKVFLLPLDQTLMFMWLGSVIYQETGVVDL